ncbi:MAG TPA: M23 family metallopeptidase [Puia sp.]|nr:M23 family metallopeptidase [Puia sp.]
MSVSKKSLLLPFLFLVHGALLAQRAIEVRYSPDTKGRYVFRCNNHDFCTYVLYLDFPTLTNARCDHALPYEAEVKPGLNPLLVISQIDPSKEIKFNYKTSSRKGCLHPVVNAGFTYLLPIAPGQETQAYRIVNKRNAAGQASSGAAGTGGTKGGAGGSGAGVLQDSGYAVRLRANIGDTIYAARRGVVTVVAVGNAENDAGASTTDSWNHVEIAHADCSFAEYGVLKKDGALVRPGQNVEAGTPIGLVGGDRYGRGSDVRFSVSYYPGVVGTEIPLQFWTKGNGKGPLKHGATYTSEFPRNLLTLEKPKPAAKKPRPRAAR